MSVMFRSVVVEICFNKIYTGELCSSTTKTDPIRKMNLGKYVQVVLDRVTSSKMRYNNYDKVIMSWQKC